MAPTTFIPGQWTDLARCRDLGADPQLRDRMFPAARSARQIAKAKRVCAGCPVTRQCLQEGDGDVYSVRAGLTGDERRRLAAGARPGRCNKCGLPFVTRPANPTTCTGCTPRPRRKVTVDDFKDEILQMHDAGCSGEQISLYFGFDRDDIARAGHLWRTPLIGRPVAECGTPAGAARHRRRGEPVCDPCRAASSLRQRRYKQAAA